MDGTQHTAYAILRDQRSWDGVTVHNLELTPEGDYTLARLPGLPPKRAIGLSGPYDTGSSGLAVGSCGDLYVADTLHDRLIFRDEFCESEQRLPGQPGAVEAPGHFLRPRGLLLCGAATLFVADSGNDRIQVLRLPGLEVRSLWENSPVSPAVLSCDSRGWVYALGLGGSIQRFYPDGRPDPAFGAALAVDSALTSPVSIAIDGRDIIYVSDSASNRVLRYDAAGSPQGPLPGPAGTSPSRPRYLFAHRDRLYVADAASGRIWVYSISAGVFLGTAPGFRGPVAAMAAGEEGSLYIKPGLDDTVYRLEAGAGYASSGSLRVGPLDAGIGDGWRRVRVDVETPPGGQVYVEQFASLDPASPPAEGDWSPVPAQDWLVPSPARYLWLRLRLQSEERLASPRLLQVQAETSGEDYMDFLPAVYRRQDAEKGFLRNWLNLFRSELADLEGELDDMHLRFNPLRTPEDHLAWLASWLGFRLPARLEPPEWRKLLISLHRLYLLRGTLRGVADFVELYCGVRPLIFEDYRQRQLWVLGQGSALGQRTGLAPVLPDGMILPDSDPPGLLVGELLVGGSAPQAAEDMGQGLFSETAHRFTVLVPAAYLPDSDGRRLLLETLEAEKPAHTDFHLCFIEARLSVGCQARLGIDAIVAGPPEPMALGQAGLGRGSSLGSGEAGISRLGDQALPEGGFYIQ